MIFHNDKLASFTKVVKLHPDHEWKIHHPQVRTRLYGGDRSLCPSIRHSTRDWPPKVVFTDLFTQSGPELDRSCIKTRRSETRSWCHPRSLFKRCSKMYSTRKIPLLISSFHLAPDFVGPTSPSLRDLWPLRVARRGVTCILVFLLKKRVLAARHSCPM